MIKRYRSSNRFCLAIEHNGVFTTAGQVARDFKADVTQQSVETLEAIDSLLEEAGIGKENILSAMIWLADIKDYDAFNQVWDKWVDSNNPPTRACVEARLATPDIKVEVAIVAARD